MSIKYYIDRAGLRKEAELKGKQAYRVIPFEA